MRPQLLYTLLVLCSGASVLSANAQSAGNSPANLKGTANTKINVPKLALPDFIVGDVVMQPDNKTVQVLVENKGGPAKPVNISVECFTLSNVITNTKVVGEIPALGPNKSAWVKLTSVAHPNSKGVQVTVNPDKKLEEESTLNNSRSAVYLPNCPVSFAAAGEPADLLPIAIIPPQIKDNKNRTYARVINRGGTASAGFYVNFFYLRNNGGKEMGATYVKSLAPGADALVELELPLDPPNPEPGQKNPFLPDPTANLGAKIADAVSGLNNPIRYMITVDTQNTVKESNEKNNVLNYNTLAGYYQQ